MPAVYSVRWGPGGPEEMGWRQTLCFLICAFKGTLWCRGASPGTGGAPFVTFPVEKTTAISTTYLIIDCLEKKINLLFLPCGYNVGIYKYVYALISLLK